MQGRVKRVVGLSLRGLGQFLCPGCLFSRSRAYGAGEWIPVTLDCWLPPCREDVPRWRGGSPQTFVCLGSLNPADKGARDEAASVTVMMVCHRANIL